MAKSKKRDNNTGSIYKDGDAYRVAVLIGYDPATGKPIYKKRRVKSHADAVAALDQIKRDSHSGQVVISKGQTLGSYLFQWLKVKVQPLRSASTFSQYTWLVQTHIVPHLGKKRLEEVKRPDVQRLIALKATQKVQPRSTTKQSASPKNLSVSTLRLIRAVLHAAYQDAIRDGLVARNPASFVELPKEPKVRPVFLSPEQAVKLMDAAKHSDIPELLALLLTTGVRVGEALGIRWQDIDFLLAHVRICGQLQRINGHSVRIDTTKTGNERTLPLSPSLVVALQHMKNGQLVNGWADPDGLAFLNPYGRRLDQKFVHDRLKAVCRIAGLPEVSPHKLRHTAATFALAETGDLHAVQKLLGHRQVALTSNLYGHATAETLRPLSNAFERLFDSGQGKSANDDRK